MRTHCKQISEPGRNSRTIKAIDAAGVGDVGDPDGLARPHEIPGRQQLRVQTGNRTCKTGPESERSGQGGGKEGRTSHVILVARPRVLELAQQREATSSASMKPWIASHASCGT